MKITKHIIIFLILLCSYFFVDMVSAGTVELPGTSKVKTVSLSVDTGDSTDIVENINKVGFSILTMFKVILQGLMMIYIVYIGITMIISMGSDEDKLSKAKHQIRYTLVALLFINIPGTLYQAFKPTQDRTLSGGIVKNSEYLEGAEGSGNLFINLDAFLENTGVIGNIIIFMEVLIGGVAVFMIILAGINIMTSRGRDEKVSEAKNKIIVSIFALIFIGFIEAWIRLIRGGDSNGSNVLSQSATIFGDAVNLALYLAAPIALFFLTLAGYYYITSNGDEERVKKSKSIIVNTIIACVLLLVMFSFLSDLSSLNFD